MPRPFSTPHSSPLYHPLPYDYTDVRKISVFCQCSKRSLTSFLPEEFELVGDVCEIFTMEAGRGGPLGNYTEAGLVIPVSYEGQVGAHVALEYVSTDDALASGREIWGYPKKMADVPFRWGGKDPSRSSVTRRGTTLIDMTFTPGGDEVEKPALQPRLQIKTFAAADGTGDGSGHDFYQVVRNELTVTLRERIPGRVDLTVCGNDDDPLHRLEMKRIIGGEATLTDFVLDTGTILSELAA